MRHRDLCGEPYVAPGEDVNWMMACAALASSHNLKSLDPIDKITILTLKRYPKAREILTRKRAGLHGDYDRLAFERELSSGFSIIRRQELLSGTRTLYFLRPLS